MDTLVSLIVPIYNVENYLDKCIRSIVGQTYTNIEIILIDDGSVDKSGQIADKWILRDPRIIVEHQSNKGVSAARNAGIKIAKGDWICFIDADDSIDKDYVSVLSAIAEEHKVDIVVFTARNLIYEKVSIQELSKIEILNGIFDDLNIQGYPWNKMFKRNTIIRNNIYFNEKIMIWEDLLFCYNYLLHIKSAAYYKCNREDLYHYLSREDSATGTREYYREQTKLIAVENILTSDISLLYPYNLDAIKRNYANVALHVIPCYWKNVGSINKDLIHEQLIYTQKFLSYLKMGDKILYVLMNAVPEIMFRLYTRRKK